MVEIVIDENTLNILQLLLEVGALQIPSPSRPNANRSSASRRYYSRRQNRHNHHYNRRGSPLGRRGLPKVEKCCEKIKVMLRRFDLNIASIKDLISQQTELLKLAIERRPRPAS